MAPLLLACLCAWTATAPAGAPLQQAEHELFDGLRLTGARFEGPPWVRTVRGLEARGLGTALVTEQELAAGDTGVRLRLALLERGGTGAVLRIGDSAFGLDGENGALSVDGPLFGDRYAKLDDGARWFATGKPFEFEARRTGGTLTVAIDGRTATTAEVGTGALGRVALAPGRGAIVLERLALLGAVAQPAPVARDERLQEQVEAAVLRGVDWLLAAQLRDGSWRHMQYGFRGGQTAMCAYTLLRAGLPADHPSVQRAVLFLDGVDPGETYSAGWMAMAYEALRDPARRPRLEALARKLASWGPRGHWGYPNAHERDFAEWLDAPSAPDLSNTQYGVLGLRAARHAGVDVPEKLWTEIVDRTLTYQEEPAFAAIAETRKEQRAAAAGFVYHEGRAPSMSMTAAGVAVLAIAREALGGKLRGERLLAAERAIGGGVAWLGERFTTEDNPGGEKLWQYYALYGIERVGTLLDVEQLAGKDWYADGARWLLRSQSDGGAWGVGKPFGFASYHAFQDEADTCFAILFLKRASRPTVATQSPAARARELEDPTEAVRFRVRGDAPALLWIDGFSDAFRSEHGGTLGLRIARVEYVEGGSVLASVECDPTQAWEGQGFAVRHELAAAGEHELRARIHVVDPGAPTGAREPLRRLESQPVKVRSAGALEPWMRDAARARDRNLILSGFVRATASSANGSEAPELAIDGREDSRWVCARDDVAPVLVLELVKPLRADTLVLGQGGAARDIAGRYDRITEVSLRVNRDKDLIVRQLGPDELAPAFLSLGRVVALSRLEIRVTQRAPGGAWKGHVAISEAALERRGTDK